MRSSLFRAGAMTVLVTLLSCRGPENPAPVPSAPGTTDANSVSRMTVSFRVGNPVSHPRPVTPRGSSEIFALGPDTLVINSVDLVLRDLKLKTVATDSCGSGDDDGDDMVARTRGDAIADDDDEGGNDDCGDVRTGSLIVSLPLGGGALHAIPIVLPAGTYRQVEFKIHRLGNSAVDSVLLAGRPELRGVSIRVAGTFNRSAFTFSTRVEAKQKQVIDPPALVTPGSNVNLTIRVDLSTWFLNRTGTRLVDPASALAGQANEDVVERNIKRSFRPAQSGDDDDDDDSGLSGRE